MKNLHLLNTEYPDGIKALLWWITVYTWISGDMAVIKDNKFVSRRVPIKDDWPYDIGEKGLFNTWLEHGKPDFDSTKVIIE